MSQDDLQIQHDRAVDLALSGRLDEACAAFRTLVAAQPDFADAWRNLALGLARLERRDEAILAYREAYRLTGAAVNGVRLGQLLRETGRLEDAQVVLEGVVRAHPEDPEARIELGSVQMIRGHNALAVTNLTEAVRIAPQLVLAHTTLGMVHQLGRDLEPAIACFRTALALDPGSPIALGNLGSALSEDGRTSEALEVLELAVQRAPNVYTCHNNLGNALRQAGRFEEARRSFERALELMPGSADVTANLALWHAQQRELPRALELCEKALSINPDLAAAHLHRAMMWLAMGDYERGWPEYAWRWRTGQLAVRSFSQAPWRGEELPGGTVLIYCEQGLGDCLQFIRYAAQVRARVGRVIVETSPPLERLIRTVPGVDEVVLFGTKHPPYDRQVALLALPEILGTRVETIPAPIPYLSLAEPDVARRGAELGAGSRAAGRGFRIGIAWAGNPRNARDRVRSIPLAAFEALARVPGVQLFSLQKGAGREQMAQVGDRVPLTDLDIRITDLMDQALYMKNLDLVICADTAPAHLAGALGLRVWLGVPFEGEWRWLADRDDTPWYPTMRLFRQERAGDWTGVMERMARELAAELGVAVKPAASAPAAPASPRARRHEAVFANGPTRVKSCRHGAFVYLETDQYVGRALDRYGEYSEGEVTLFAQLIQPGWTVLEVGANMGAHTVPLAKLVGPTGRVLAFEPQRVMFHLLCANAALNNLAQIHAQLVAAGRAPGTVQIPFLDPAVLQNFGSLSHTQWGRGDAIPRITLDSLDLPACHFMKIDVEGMELDVIAGAERTLSRYRPSLYVENDREQHSAALIARLLALGYRLYWHTPPLYSPQNHFANRQNDYPGVVSINMLCLPAEMPQRINGLREITDPRADWRAL